VARGPGTTLSCEAGGLRIDRPADAIRSLARPVEDGPAEDIAGLYRSEELDSELEVIDAGGSWFAGFRGILGQGPMMAMTPAGAGVWRLACHRSLDAPSPGDWTVRLAQPGAERALRVGCWLARDVVFLGVRRQ
jgi:D-aminopeptidase